MVYDALKDVIENTNFKLENILDKIYVMYSKDRLSKEEMDGCVWSPDIYPSAWEVIEED